MTAIVANSQLTTAVTVYDVAPEHQQQLIDILVNAAGVLRKQKGFISINIHKSADGTQVLRYSQWQSRQAFDAVLQNAKVIPFVQAILKLATFEPHFYEVVAVVQPDAAADESEAPGRRSNRKGGKK
jgi:quinol monooxygenase YgiN